jgi:hypothetical protein
MHLLLLLLLLLLLHLLLRLFLLLLHLLLHHYHYHHLLLLCYRYRHYSGLWNVLRSMMCERLAGLGVVDDEEGTRWRTVADTSC